MRSWKWGRLTGLAMALAGFSESTIRAQDAPKAEASPSETPRESKNETKVTVKPKVVVFRLAGSVTETPSEDFSLFGGVSSVALKDLVERMEKAIKDEAVKAVVLLPAGGSVGPAQIEELRQAMARLNDAGKPVYAHADSLTMGEFVLLSGCARLSIVPTADVWVTGLYAESPYLRGLLNKLDIQPDYLACGDYKSASEIFMRSGPSPEAERMQNWLLDSLFETYLSLIAEGRKVDPKTARSWIDNGPYTAETARVAGLIDAIEHRQAFEAMLKDKYGDELTFDKKYGRKEEPKPDLSTPFGLFRFLGELMGGGAKTAATHKKSVAIVYVDGPIVLSETDGMSLLGGGQSAVAGRIRRALDEAASDDTIKAVVLRVSSPGGSAVASEIILDATERVKAKKPFVVSMGDVAGSGGYYVAMASDLIFADRATITASIGVVGGKLATEGLFDKVGVSFKSYQRGENAGMLSSSNVFTERERTKMQAWMDDIYGVFKGHVSKNRGDKLAKPLDELAGGRVFTGAQALELGLIDKLGTMYDAIAHVAAEADLGEDFELRVLPKPRSFLEQLLDDSSEFERSKGLDASEPSRPTLPRPGLSLLELAAPLLESLDAPRAALVRSALGRLELINREGVILMMPELRFGL